MQAALERRFKRVPGQWAGAREGRACGQAAALVAKSAKASCATQGCANLLFRDGGQAVAGRMSATGLPPNGGSPIGAPLPPPLTRSMAPPLVVTSAWRPAVRMPRARCVGASSHALAYHGVRAHRCNVGRMSPATADHLSMQAAVQASAVATHTSGHRALAERARGAKVHFPRPPPRKGMAAGCGNPLRRDRIGERGRAEPLADTRVGPSASRAKHAYSYASSLRRAAQARFLWEASGAPLRFRSARTQRQLGVAKMTRRAPRIRSASAAAPSTPLASRFVAAGRAQDPQAVAIGLDRAPFRRP